MGKSSRLDQGGGVSARDREGRGRGRRWSSAILEIDMHDIAVHELGLGSWGLGPGYTICGKVLSISISSVPLTNVRPWIVTMD